MSNFGGEVRSEKSSVAPIITGGAFIIRKLSSLPSDSLTEDLLTLKKSGPVAGLGCLLDAPLTG